MSERATFALPPSRLALEPSDLVSLSDGHRTHELRITEIGEHGARDVTALGSDRTVYAPPAVTLRPVAVPAAPRLAGQPRVEFLDLPLLNSSDAAESAYVAAAQDPWPGGIALYRAPEEANFRLAAELSAPAVFGTTLDPLPAAPSGRITRPGQFRIALDRGALASVTPLALFSGANLAAVCTPEGTWEVFQFRSAQLVAPATYALGEMLRGQGGTEHAMRAPLAAGVAIVRTPGGRDVRPRHQRDWYVYCEPHGQESALGAHLDSDLPGACRWRFQPTCLSPFRLMEALSRCWWNPGAPCSMSCGTTWR